MSGDRCGAAGVITIKNWSKFQHYSKRLPPWIKLHRSLLDANETPWYRALSDNGARWLVELWLLASREIRGTIPYDTLMIVRDVGRTTADISSLNRALIELASVGAIAIAGTDASAEFLAPLATRGTEIQRDRGTETFASQTAGAGQQNEPERQAPHAVLMPLIRDLFYAPDRLPPPGWNDRRDGDIVNELLKSGRSVQQLEMAIRGLRLLVDHPRRWVEDYTAPARPGDKLTMRLLYNTHLGKEMPALTCALQAYFRYDNQRSNSDGPDLDREIDLTNQVRARAGAGGR